MFLRPASVTVTASKCTFVEIWRQAACLLIIIRRTRLIAIKVMRVPGNPLIKGTFWLDDVKLTLAQTAAADH